MLISVGTSIYNLVQSQTENVQVSTPNYFPSEPIMIYLKRSKLTLSSTAPGSMPNLSAMGTIRSGRLQLFVNERETLVKFGRYRLKKQSQFTSYRCRGDYKFLNIYLNAKREKHTKFLLCQCKQLFRCLHAYQLAAGRGQES